jgi:hypothetical protein
MRLIIPNDGHFQAGAHSGMVMAATGTKSFSRFNWTVKLPNGEDKTIVYTTLERRQTEVPVELR